MTFKLVSDNDITKVFYTDSPFSKIIANEVLINSTLKFLLEYHGETKITPSARLIKIEPRAMKKFINKQPISILSFNKIVKFCEINNTNIRDGISYIDNIKEPNIPLNFESLSGVRLDAGIFNEGRMRNRTIEYHNKDNEILSILLNAGKNVIGRNFNPPIGVDKRNENKCIYFPPYFSKHYTKLKTTESRKSKLDLRIPGYVFNSEKFQKVWWRANLSEEASLYYHIIKINSRFFINPLIQLNRVREVNVNILQNKEIRFYHKSIPTNLLETLKNYNHTLLKDEQRILDNFNISSRYSFSSLYKSKKGNQTAVYTLLINKIKDLEKFNSEIGFELYRQKRQLNLLLNNNGTKTREQMKEIIIKFYKLVPSYLRGIKKIKKCRLLEKEDINTLLKENDTSTNRDSTWTLS